MCLNLKTTVKFTVKFTTFTISVSFVHEPGAQWVVSILAPTKDKTW